ncbi:MAG: DNA primase [Geminicoccaceae bacterium]|nr:DNA primase [Geminicoccaceae bacterium]
MSSSISLDEFKSRLPIAEIIGRHVRLVRRGRELTGLCPFHNEKTPSFTVAEAKGFFHCFGCGKHGNAIDFVMEIEGLDFGEALARLAEQTGLPLPSGGERRRVDRTLLAANEAAARWYQGRLEGSAGAEARRYLAGRGLDDDTILAFQLGYAPNARDGLLRALLAEGYQEDQLVAAGLVVRPEDGRPVFDRFRERVVFPIHDQRGRLVGFGGRALGEARAKYLNTAETELFHKGELLYGYDHAQKMARTEGAVVVVEGYMDVLALARVGLSNAVAPLGTALTETQLRWLWRLADAPVVCLDGDAAGLRAAHRLIERALPLLEPGRSLRFVLLPEGEDPDSMIRSRGPEALRERLGRTVHFLDFLWRAETVGLDLSQPERRAALDRRFRDLARTIADRDVRYRFQEALRGRLRGLHPANGPQKRGERRAQPGRTGPRPVEDNLTGAGAGRLAAALKQERRRQEGGLLTPILKEPALLLELEEDFAALELEEPDFILMRECITVWYAERQHLEAEALRDHLCETGLSRLVGELSGLRDWSSANAGETDRSARCAAWRERVAAYRRYAERRALGEAAAEAILGAGEDEQRARLLALRRLLDPKDRANERPAFGDA